MMLFYLFLVMLMPGLRLLVVGLLVLVMLVVVVVGMMVASLVVVSLVLGMLLVALLLLVEGFPFPGISRSCKFTV